MSILSQVMLKPSNQLFYAKAHLNIQLFLKIFKIKKNKQKLEEWPDKDLKLYKID